jgi:hypothetical protein
MQVLVRLLLAQTLDLPGRKAVTKLVMSLVDPNNVRRGFGFGSSPVGFILA